MPSFKEARQKALQGILLATANSRSISGSRGMAWHGVAWRGMAWHGVACRWWSTRRRSTSSRRCKSSKRRPLLVCCCAAVMSECRRVSSEPKSSESAPPPPAPLWRSRPRPGPRRPRRGNGGRFRKGRGPRLPASRPRKGAEMLARARAQRSRRDRALFVALVLSDRGVSACVDDATPGRASGAPGAPPKAPQGPGSCDELRSARPCCSRFRRSLARQERASGQAVQGRLLSFRKCQDLVTIVKDGQRNGGQPFKLRPKQPSSAVGRDQRLGALLQAEVVELLRCRMAPSSLFSRAGLAPRNDHKMLNLGVVLVSL